MDPNETLRLYRAALAAEDAEEAAEHAKNLRHWIAFGGFLPDGVSEDEKVVFGAALAPSGMWV